MPNQPHRTWIEQADAAEGILDRFGPEQALSYIVGEKFINFLDAAATRPEFEAEVPGFTARLREMLEPHHLRAFLDRRLDPDLSPDVEDSDTYDVTSAAERMMLIERAKELLLPAP